MALKNSNHMPPPERKRRRAKNKAKRDVSMENFEGRPTYLPRPSPEGETEEINLKPERSEKMVKIRADLADDVKANLISL